MLRVRWCGATHSVLCLFVAIAGILWSFWIVAVQADCWYEDETHEEGKEVATAEPCLNCTCSRGALLCYLRVCPKYPNPPPKGCILLHRYRSCCPELICPEFTGNSNAIEARSDPETDLEFSFDTTILKNACISNGSIYGPGSAMDTSSTCEYCYCLAGKQTCIKPKCLLPVEGCTPVFDPTYCCPIHYNCSSNPRMASSSSTTSSSTTTERPQRERGGCMVDGFYHPEGGKVLGIGHAVCDNCYCLKGLVRCEPLSCAPPLLGCAPVIKPGDCCAASYNCSGTIEIQPEPYYGNFPIISKEYAKFRKEVHKKRPFNLQDIVTVSSLYASSETAHSKQRSPGSFGTTRHFTGVALEFSTKAPSLTREKNKLSTRSYATNRDGILTTTNQDIQDDKDKVALSTSVWPKHSESATVKRKNEEHAESSDYLDFIHENLFSLFDANVEENSVENGTETTSERSTETTTTDVLTTTKILEDISTDLSFTSSPDESTETISSSTTSEDASATTNTPLPITVRSVLKSTDCIQSKDNTLIEAFQPEASTILPVDANQVNNLVDVRRTVHLEDSSTTELDDFATTTEDHKVKQAAATLRNIPDAETDIDTILNMSKPKIADYDYDYGRPTLPPSLPNLRIIPFVAEDAVDVNKDLSKEEMDYPEERIIESDTGFGYHNHFSPPAKTEGGFVPKEPPILEKFYGNAVTSSTFDEAEPNANCITHDGIEVTHGQSVASDSPCTTCTCFYGNIACQKPNCPTPGPNCRKSTVQDLTLCCPRYVCGDEAPTVVLDLLNGTLPQEIITVAEKVSTPDPFRDVIRTEPAPDLQSLIIDMVPYLTSKTTTTKPKDSHTKTTPTIPTEKTTAQASDDELSLDKVLQLLFSGERDVKIEATEPTTTKIQTELVLVDKTADRPSTMSTTPMHSVEEKSSLPDTSIVDSSDSNQIDSGAGSALLINLAGCNIYGRMYRVGRIISELSGPCLECKCTEIGVHCKELKC